jgi:uncharacterized protein (TIGR02147 family)
MINIFDYTDYRKYLDDFYKARKAADKKFTHRHIANEVGFKSTGFFTLILQNKSNISTKIISKFVKFLKLKKNEADYFEMLVLFNQARNHTEKKRYFEKMLAFKKSNITVVDSRQYEFYEKWYYTVVREILAFFPFKDNYKELARMVSPPISVGEAKKAIEVLQRLGFIEKDGEGFYKRREAIITTGYDAKSIAINQFVLDAMDMAKEAMDHFPRDKRSLSALTLSLPPEGYEIVEEKVKKFRRELLELAKTTPKPRRVIQVNFQVFPLSQTYEEDKK